MAPWLVRSETVIHHQLQVKLTPENGELQVRDTITLPAPNTPLRFGLNAGFAAASPDPAVRFAPDPGTPFSRTVKFYRVVLPQGRTVFTMSYQGKPDLAAAETVDQQNQGYISSNGAYLDGGSYWYPIFGAALATFSVEVELPASWKAVSQGTLRSNAAARQNTVIWKEAHPQEDIYLLAAPYHEYRRSTKIVDTQVLLHSADPTLAEQYLSVMGDDIAMYSRLLGPYPYSKFAVVENIWESGFGMPSFTLLGPRVMRFPFILRSSLPHEILHNWWGNGVYVDYVQGNWSEGLTAYLADHLLREQSGEGAAYRRNALLRYTNYVSAGNDFALKDFQGRHNEATQAVGYDKALMVFHMLRVQLGDERFIAALRGFYREKKFHRAGWDDLRRAFEAEAQESLQSDFDQWLNRRGAPSLQVHEAHAEEKDGHYVLSAELEQNQPGPAYRLHVPLAVQLEGHDQAWQTMIELAQQQQTIHLTLPARPWRLQVDPEFDVFRRLDLGELPPTLSEALGAGSLLIVLPSAAPPPLRDAYARIAQTWAESGQGIELQWDKDLAQLPGTRPVWLMGWENRFFAQLATGLPPQAALSGAAAELDGQLLRRDANAVVLAARRGGAALLWLGCDNPAAFPGLARKLPHYGGYSYLAFQGDEPTNTLKGQWQVLDSPLNIAVQQSDHATPTDKPFRLRPRTALIKE